MGVRPSTRSDDEADLRCGGLMPIRFGLQMAGTWFSPPSGKGSTGRGQTAADNLALNPEQNLSDSGSRAGWQRASVVSTN